MKTLTVTSLADDGSAGTLRSQIAAAAADDTIDFKSGLSGTITLNGTAIRISKNLTIQGPGANIIAVSGNNASRIFTISTGTIAISGLTITKGNDYSNIASSGSGILNSAILTLSNCGIIGNSSAHNVHLGGHGGGITNSGTLTIINTTISGNEAIEYGGGIDNSGTLTITNTTISGNGANGGGGIDNSGTLTITNSTVSGNTSGISNNGTFNLRNSIIAANRIIFAGPDISGIVASGDYNLVQNTSGATLSGSHNITGQDPKLGALANNGGPTQTMALLEGSPAIDAGDPDFNAANTPYDQRGQSFTRVQGERVDIGAFESPAPQVGGGNDGATDQRFVDCFNRNGGQAVLGKPTTFVLAITSDGGNGLAQTFQGGTATHASIIAKDSATMAFAVASGVLDCYGGLGGHTGVLGFAVTDEFGAAPSPQGTKSRLQAFEGGSIYSSVRGIHAVTGAIFKKYTENGKPWTGTGGALGVPAGDEQNAPNSPQGTTGGRLLQFEGGAIYWTQAYGTHPVYGVIGQQYTASGGSKGQFGFPTSDPYASAQGMSQNFEGGPITINVSSPYWQAMDLAVGSDNLSHMLWTRPDKAFALWTVSASNAVTSTPLFGPITGWSATAIGVGGDSKMRLLINNANGQAADWTIQNPVTGNITSTPAYGAYSGLTCREVAAAPNNTTRLLWVRNDGAFAVWTVDSTGNFTSTPLFGPIAGWSASAISVGGDNKTTILLNNSNGQAAVWTVQNASTGNITSTPAYGPISGFLCRDLATGSDNKTRLLWVRNDGAFAVWTVDATGNFASTPLFGPIAGWSGIKVAVGGDLKTRVLLTNTDGRAAVWTLDGAGNITSTPAFGPLAAPGASIVRSAAPVAVRSAAPEDVVKSAGPVRDSPFALSSASANAARGTITLTFTGPLDVTTVTATNRYKVTVNKMAAVPENVTVSGGNSVTVSMEKGSLPVGASVEAGYRLLDAEGRALAGTATIRAR